MCDKIAMRTRKRLSAPPFRLGWSTIWPGTHIGYIPDRYWANLESYIADGGASSSLDVKKFIKGNKKNNCGDLARYYMFRLIFDQIKKEKLEGDLLELGVYKGNTASLLAEMARDLGRTAYLLDTYGGLPKHDLTGVNARTEASFAETSAESARELGGDQNRPFTQGRFPETAAPLAGNAAHTLVHP